MKPIFEDALAATNHRLRHLATEVGISERIYNNTVTATDFNRLISENYLQAAEPKHRNDPRRSGKGRSALRRQRMLRSKDYGPERPEPSDNDQDLNVLSHKIDDINSKPMPRPQAIDTMGGVAPGSLERVLADIARLTQGCELGRDFKIRPTRRPKQKSTHTPDTLPGMARSSVRPTGMVAPSAGLTVGPPTTGRSAVGGYASVGEDTNTPSGGWKGTPGKPAKPAHKTKTGQIVPARPPTPPKPPLAPHAPVQPKQSKPPQPQDADKPKRDVDADTKPTVAQLLKQLSVKQATRKDRKSR